MTKKIFILPIILLLIVTTSTSVAIQHLELKDNSTISNETQLLPKLSLMETTTIQDFITILYTQIQQLPTNSLTRYLLTKSIEQGMKQIKKIGITSETSLSETQEILVEITPNVRPRARFFIINIYPDDVQMLLTTPPHVINLSNNGSANETLEILFKIMPLVDFIQTEQRIIIRKLYQYTSFILPAIGGRILEDNTTKFILVFGPGIRWDWRLL